jgi:hypothetical protein
MKKFKFRGSVFWMEFPRSLGDLSISGNEDNFGVWQGIAHFKTVANNSAEIFLRQGIIISKWNWEL